jgi:hypothetical protein
MDRPSNYWQEAAATALEESGVSATREQIKEIGAYMEGYAEQESMAYVPVEDCRGAEIASLNRRIKELKPLANEAHYFETLARERLNRIKRLLDTVQDLRDEMAKTR